MEKSEQTRVSVAMTTYRPGKYLKEQLDSIRHQTRAADEVIIVDDCSGDQTAGFLRSYIEENGLDHWTVYENDANLGYIRSFQEAIGRCSGDWIFLCDHDDRWHPEKIAAMLDRQSGLPQTRALFSSFHRIDQDGKFLEDLSTKKRPNQQLIRRSLRKSGGDWIEFDDLLFCNVAQGCALMISKDLAGRYLSLKDQLSHLPHDYALNALASLDGKEGLYFFDEPLFDYRIHSGNTLGLRRQTQYEKRTADAIDQAVQKKELLLLGRMFGTPEQQENALQMEKIFSGRAQALKDKDPFALLAMIPASRRIPTLYLTLGLDARLAWSSRTARRKKEKSSGESL